MRLTIVYKLGSVNRFNIYINSHTKALTMNLLCVYRVVRVFNILGTIGFGYILFVFLLLPSNTSCMATVLNAANILEKATGFA